MCEQHEAARRVNVETSHQATAPLASLLGLKSSSDLRQVCVHVCVYVNERVLYAFPGGPDEQNRSRGANHKNPQLKPSQTTRIIPPPTPEEKSQIKPVGYSFSRSGAAQQFLTLAANKFLFFCLFVFFLTYLCASSVIHGNKPAKGIFFIWV